MGSEDADVTFFFAKGAIASFLVLKAAAATFSFLAFVLMGSIAISGIFVGGFLSRLSVINSGPLSILKGGARSSIVDYEGGAVIEGRRTLQVLKIVVLV